MAATSACEPVQINEGSGDSERSSDNVLDSDDSARDKDYVQSDTDSETSSDESDQVDLQKLWLVPFFSQMHVACAVYSNN